MLRRRVRSTARLSPLIAVAVVAMTVSTAKAQVGGGVVLSPGSGLGNLNGVYQPGYIGAGVLTPTCSINPIGPGDGLGAGPANLANLINVAMSAFNYASLIMTLDKKNDAAGFQYDEGVDPEWAGGRGSSINSMWTDAEQGCQKFISKDGKVGPWGRTALEEMDQHKEIYEENVPADVSKFCPAFGVMDAQRRRYFWLWFFSSLSSPESSCNSGAANPNAPNGTAIGLFQLEAPACARVGKNVTSAQLYDPHVNTRCAVAVFANEMKNRSTIMIGHSRGKGGTYWGPLRNDDRNRARGGDISAAQKTRSLLAQYDDCQNMSPDPAPTVAPAEEEAPVADEE